MNQTERFRRIKCKQALEQMMETEGWQLLEGELERLREQSILSLSQSVESHPKMSQHSGKLALLTAITLFVERTIRDGLEAARPGDTSDEE